MVEQLNSANSRHSGATVFAYHVNDPDGGNIKYQIQIDNNSDFSSPELSYTSGFSLVEGRTFTSPELSDGSYYFRVKAIDPLNIESGWSVANNGQIAFKVDATVPSIPGEPKSPRYHRHLDDELQYVSHCYLSRNGFLKPQSPTE